MDRFGLGPSGPSVVAQRHDQCDWSCVHDGGGGRVRAGGVGPFAGILVHPRHYDGFGGLSGILAPRQILPNGVQAEVLYRGNILAALPATARVGDGLMYHVESGVLDTVGADRGASWIPIADAEVSCIHSNHGQVSEFSHRMAVAMITLGGKFGTKGEQN